jgi:prepilin-type N-terminal cleavage/methylation domain-containing protein
MEKGFTLIEILIVMAILAVLATGTVLLLDPVEKFREARDGQRLADLKNLTDAIAFYFTRTTSPVLNFGICDAENTDPTHPWRASATTIPGTSYSVLYVGQPFSYPITPVDSASILATDVRNVDGTGWVSVPFQAIGNSPLAKLPIDPVNVALNDLAGAIPSQPPAYFYAYQCQGLTYEINANMESAKFSFNGSKDVESKDGGTLARKFNGATFIVDQATANLIYEVGNDPGLDL